MVIKPLFTTKTKVLPKHFQKEADAMVLEMLSSGVIERATQTGVALRLLTPNQWGMG